LILIDIIWGGAKKASKMCILLAFLLLKPIFSGAEGNGAFF